MTTHSCSQVMKCETLSDASNREVSWIRSRVTRLSFAHQLSNHKFMLVPSLTFHCMPLWNCSRLVRIYFQAHELDCFGLAHKKVSLIWYLAHICSTHGLCSWKSFHISLLRNALLIISIFWRPKPPELLGRQILSQETIDNPLTLEDVFEKKSLLSLSIYLMMAQGSWKHCIVWVGIVSAFAYINAIGPSLEILLVAQDWSRRRPMVGQCQ